MSDTSADNLGKAQYASPEEALKKGGRPGIVRMWVDAIDAQTKLEKDWRKRAEDVCRVYRSDSEIHDIASPKAKQTAFNILYSNTETLLPALYNSTPIPDIRRRYGDPGEASKAVAQMLERALVYSLDRYDFDAEFKAVLYDAVLPGRGVARVRYVPTIKGDDAEDEADEQGTETPEQESDEHVDNQSPPEPGERVTAQDVRLEYVHWKNFRRGPGLVWSDVPWIAFEHFMSEEQVEDICEGGKVDCEDVPLNYDVEGNRRGDEEGQPEKGDIFKRAHVWEIWDRKNRKVIWLCPDYPWDCLREDDDPLQLEGFFPLPRPIVPVETPGDLTPVPPYEAYRELAEELNEVTDRIRRLVRQIRVRGWYGAATQDLQQLVQAADGELVPAQSLEVFTTTGGDLNKAIGWWPIEPQVKALAQLYDQREKIKEAIYEVSGLSDILRGASQASETATAQNIKNQWGSLRIQRLQAEIARFIRDVFRIKAELIANHFDIGFLSTMTGVKVVPKRDKLLAQQKIAAIQQNAMMAQQQAQPQPGGPPQGAPAPAAPPVPKELQDILDAPTVEEVEPLLRDDLMRSFKIDVESDSTIRADLTRNQQTMGEFVQGTAAYIQAVGPAVQAGLLPPNAAVDIYAAFARQFKLGKQVEDTLDKMSQDAQAQAQKPQPQKPDPEMVKAQAEVQAKQQELQLKQAEMQAKLQQQQQQHELDLQMLQQKAELDRELALYKAQTERETKLHQMAMEADARRQQMAQDAEMHAEQIQQARQGNMMAANQHVMDMQTADAAGQMAAEKHQAGLAAMKAKAQQATKPQPRK